VVMLIITPVRLILSGVAGAILTVIGGRQPAQELGVREEEFRSLVDVGSEVGELQVAERRLIHNVFEFGDTTVGKVMTPADKVFALPYEMPLGRLVEAVATQRFSRVPIYKTRKGARKGSTGEMEVEGVLLAKDLVGYARGQLEGHTIQELLHPPLFVPRTTKCDRLFREFQRRKTHIALVVDEYGRLSGLVTMEDLLEELFGEIADEKESRA
jgi:putative hemolysin